MAERSRFAKSLRSPFQWIGVGVIVVFILAVAYGPTRPSGPRASPGLQSSRTIALAMFQYANDHQGAYPTGKSSTEVFQKLIDERYISDPAIFCVEIFGVPGKIKATSNVLKPENVSFDVTVPLDDKASDSLPVVFSTGYRVHYVPGGSAVPLHPESGNRMPGICVCYHSNSASYHANDGQPDGAVTNFISPDFDPAGKTYQQLTPDGPLAP